MRSELQPSNARARAEEAAALVAALLDAAKKDVFDYKEIADLKETVAIDTAARDLQAAVVVNCAERILAAAAGLGERSLNNPRYCNMRLEKGFPTSALPLLVRLLRRTLPFSADQVHVLARLTAELRALSSWNQPYLPGLVSVWESYVKNNGLTEPLRAHLSEIEAGLKVMTSHASSQVAERIAALRRDSSEEVKPRLLVGEAWSDKAIADLEAMAPAARSSWNSLLVHCQNADGAKPTKKWIDAARAAIDQIGLDEFRARVLAWFPLVDKPRTQHIETWSEWAPNPNLLIIEPHSELLKGLAWACGLHDDVNLARALGALAVSAYKKVPMVGPRAVKVGNACVHALGAMPGVLGVTQLAIIKAKVKFGPAQKGIEKALAASAARVGVAPDEIEELATPTLGFQEIGLRRETLGDFTAELAVVGSTGVELRWFRADGKPQKTLPAAVKESHADELKELKASAKDAQNLLAALRERLDSLFLAQRSWPVSAWRERFADHPLTGLLARRLIWECESGGRKRSFMFLGDATVDAADRVIDLSDPPADAVIRIWHPIDRPRDEVMAWREWLERHEIRQPFKQAHREVYLLTDAERRTNTYSNRFAAHVLRQHQFNALCALRGWKSHLRIMADAEYPPPTRKLPGWNLRAEFWIESVGENFGEDTTEAGAYLRVTTDQVRFYPIDAGENYAHAGGGGYHLAPGDPIPLERIPPLVLSEIMRDVDLFVGVASVGNDPTWADGGPQGRFRDYWNEYSFGELSGTAQSRKETLERLIPRLRIAARCTFEDRYLVVRGDLRTYKIHLGSGNILMEPGAQYLCIIKAQSQSSIDAGKVFLPFEGDGVLSIILSKAFMLASDTTITDETITRQIKGK